MSVLIQRNSNCKILEDMQKAYFNGLKISSIKYLSSYLEINLCLQKYLHTLSSSRVSKSTLASVYYSVFHSGFYVAIRLDFQPLFLMFKHLTRSLATKITNVKRI